MILNSREAKWFNTVDTGERYFEIWCHWLWFYITLFHITKLPSTLFHIITHHSNFSISRHPTGKKVVCTGGLITYQRPKKSSFLLCHHYCNVIIDIILSLFWRHHFPDVIISLTSQFHLRLQSSFVISSQRIVEEIICKFFFFQDKELRKNVSNLYLLSLVTSRASIGVLVVPARITGKY